MVMIEQIIASLRGGFVYAIQIFNLEIQHGRMPIHINTHAVVVSYTKLLTQD